MCGISAEFIFGRDRFYVSLVSGSSVRESSLVSSNDKDKALLHRSSSGAEKGVLAGFKAFILHPVQAVMFGVNQLLQRPALKPAQASDNLERPLQPHGALRANEGARLLQSLELVESYARTSCAKAAKDVREEMCKGVSARQGSATAELMVAGAVNRAAESVAQSFDKRVVKSITKSAVNGVVKIIANSVAKNGIAKLIANIEKGLVEGVSKIDAKSIAQSIEKIDAKSIAKSVEKTVEQNIAKSLEKYVAQSVAQNIAKNVAENVAESVERTVEKGIAQKVDIDRPALADNLNQFAKTAYDVINNIDLQANTPAPEPTAEALADMKTWMGSENSQDRLSKLREGLLSIKGKDIGAAVLLVEFIQDIEIDAWAAGGPAIDDWFKNASPMEKKEVAVKLNDWADKATGLLLKLEFGKLQVKDQGRAASRQWSRV